jgi:hypothetical protein
MGSKAANDRRRDTDQAAWPGGNPPPVTAWIATAAPVDIGASDFSTVRYRKKFQ